jgi:hypothetical protein
MRGILEANTALSYCSSLQVVPYLSNVDNSITYLKMVVGPK